ncbi:hypothetical protein PoB_006135300 [Plakobranchus ocellatus]|uniref:Uncharacterized protein n=1 Tax=Plakobranchus ocellatus TaxID=259542 RepID=A0AAV4CSN0_9GAST|nr:hypothetical protein PoB_006135300 [Plakobranchus ocellatus]
MAATFGDPMSVVGFTSWLLFKDLLKNWVQSYLAAQFRTSGGLNFPSRGALVCSVKGRYSRPLRADRFSSDATWHVTSPRAQPHEVAVDVAMDTSA